MCTNVEESSKKTRRQESVKHHLEIAGLKHTIRKIMFLDILGISEQFVFTLFEKKVGDGRILPDMILINGKGPGIDIDKYIMTFNPSAKAKFFLKPITSFLTCLKLNPTLRVNDLIMLIFFPIKLCVLILK